jgi:hypothetical protein
VDVVVVVWVLLDDVFNCSCSISIESLIINEDLLLYYCSIVVLFLLLLFIITLIIFIFIIN